MNSKLAFAALACLEACATAGEATSRIDSFEFEPMPAARFRFEGAIGDRIRANTDNWLLRAPGSNPGMIGMFKLRDRKPAPNLVPWAGEFAGKYLISAVQSLRLTDHPTLINSVARVVESLLACQAEDGYLGPFPEKDRLQGNWDLWGHYHCMLGLLEWHKSTGDSRVLDACTRMADLMCRLYLDGSRRVYDAGSHEMNMAVIHGLCRLYRLTGQSRHLELIRMIEQDWERTGDYLRTGIAGVEFFQTPRPRWESLHDLQGLVELYAITGDARYRQAFEHHWRSIARFDKRNSGAFSSGEQATGNPYEPTPIETCCTVAWMALSIDMLRLTGESRVADELELTTLNAAAGAQHPSGSWWTYSTPMDGLREASAHSIVFQARAGTPELNCCSVNGPRSLAMLGEWAVMRTPGGLVLNWLGPMEARTSLPNGAAVVLQVESDFPANGDVLVKIVPASPLRFKLRVRIPSWSARAAVLVDGQAIQGVEPGTYLDLDRIWSSDSRIKIELDMSLRAVAGARQMRDKVSVYRGPILLAYDQRHNAFDEDDLPALDLARLPEARVVKVKRSDSTSAPDSPWPWVMVDAPGVTSSLVRLCDFATAGASGTRYRSWLNATNAPPPPLFPILPRDGASIPPGRALFRWSKPGPHSVGGATVSLAVWEAGNRANPALVLKQLEGDRAVLAEKDMNALSPRKLYEWEMRTVRDGRLTTSGWPYPTFRIDLALPILNDLDVEAFLAPIPDVIVGDKLQGRPDPWAGRVASAQGISPSDGPRTGSSGAVLFDGVRGRIVYAIEEFPDEDYSAAVWVRIRSIPEARLGQIVSAWARGMDDPLRVAVDGGKLHARIEAGQAYGTGGIPIAPGRWHCVAVVKQGSSLTLWLDGKARSKAAVPSIISSSSRLIALGGNPLFDGNEFLAMDATEFRLFGRALSENEVVALSAFDTQRER